MKILMLTSYSSVYGGNFIPSLEAFAQYSIKRGDSVGFALNTDAQGCDWLSLIHI